ncbi:MAG: hypothetical protein GY849_17980 [Deltaproteobacteria bacterium]|nr:hypothetical protein [Deltaproteobacteria bacterium]
MEIIKVIWRDSNIYIEQCHKTDVFSYETLITYGKLIQENKEQIVVAGDILGDEVRRVIVIPKENIISIKKLYENS